MAFLPKHSLEARVNEVRSSGAPDRRLIFDVELRNHTDERLVVLNSEVTVSLGDWRIAEGDLLRLHFALVASPVVDPGSGHLVGELSVPVTREALGFIEERRSGDVEYSISIYLRIAPIGDDERIGLPRQVSLELRKSRDRIPLSTWLSLLRAWGWDETTLIELPRGSTAHTHPVAVTRWEEAVEQYRAGNWEDVLGSCRKCLEALALEKTPGHPTKPDMKRLADYFDDPEKSKHLDPMLKELSGFLHLGRHQQVSTRITRRDALFALSMTASLLKYIG